MDERAAVFVTKKKFFYYNFSLGKDNQTISMSQYTLTCGLPFIKTPKNTLACL